MRPRETSASAYRTEAVEFTNGESQVREGPGQQTGFGSLGDLFRNAADYVDRRYGVGEFVLLGVNFDEDQGGKTLTLFFEEVEEEEPAGDGS